MLQVLEHDAIRELRLARPPVNAFDPALLASLAQQLTRATADDVDAVILSGQPGVFSAGLDVRALAQLDATALRGFVNAFFDLQQQLASAPMPVLCSITGHCPAGGTVLALYCDRRFMARGVYTIGLNEVQIGLYPGQIIYRAFERLVGSRQAADLLPRGTLLDPEAAHRVGLVDELTDEGHTTSRALEYGRELLALPRAAYLRTRALVRGDLVQSFETPRDAFIDVFAEHWFSAETRARLAHLLRSQGA